MTFEYSSLYARDRGVPGVPLLQLKRRRDGFSTVSSAKWRICVRVGVNVSVCSARECRVMGFMVPELRLMR